MQSWLWPGPLVFKVCLFFTVLSCFCQKFWAQHTPRACLSWEQTETPQPNQAYPKYRLVGMKPRCWRHLSFISFKNYVWLDISQSRGCNSSSLPMHQPWEHWLLSTFLCLNPFSLIIFWQFPSFSLRTAVIYSIVELWEGAEGSRREGALRLWDSAEPTTWVLGSWLKQIHYSGTVQPHEQWVKLGYREVEGSCHILSMKSGSSINQSTWNRLANYLPTPKHPPPLRSYLTRPPPILHCSQSCPVSENPTCLSERKALPQYVQLRAKPSFSYVPSIRLPPIALLEIFSQSRSCLSFVSLFLPVENSAAGNLCHSLPLTAAWTDCNLPDWILQQQFTPTLGKSTHQHPSGV